jgi:signal transduction histidine kinase
VKKSLKGKLILSYLAVALITVLVVSVVIRLTSGQSLMNLVVEQQTTQLRESAQAYYSGTGSMEGFFEYYILQSAFNPKPPEPGYFEGGVREIRGLHGLVDEDLNALIPFAGIDIGDKVPEDQMKHAVAVQVDGKTVAWILPDTKFQFSLNAEEQLFLRRTNLAIGLAALAGVLVAVGMGFLLAGGLLKPIRRLTKASQEMAHGELQQQVPVTSQDELGQLTATFNKMSLDLFEADQKRRQMTADITHDLSTPLQIISGYIEMLESGEVNLSPERIEIIKTEINNLRRLVGDMTTLTQAESGGLEIQLQAVKPGELMERIILAFQPIVDQKNIQLAAEINQDLPEIMVDEGRMIQVLKNLVENAIRYTPSRGNITLSADADEKVNMRVKDSGEGIAAEDLPYVFDRFYRADKARGRNTGKLGLGLAICKTLVNTMGGTISADSEGKEKGTSIVISFPPISTFPEN